MKKCINCGIDKPYIEYYKHKGMSSGYLGRCKECHKSAMRRNRAEKADYYREYDAWRFQNQPQVRERHLRYQATESGKASMDRSRRKYIENNPEKRSAHLAVESAVKSGLLKKPNNCSECGNETASRRLHGHHEDYSRKLDVIWLCVDCHAGRHRVYKQTT